MAYFLQIFVFSIQPKLSIQGKVLDAKNRKLIRLGLGGGCLMPWQVYFLSTLLYGLIAIVIFFEFVLTKTDKEK